MKVISVKRILILITMVMIAAWGAFAIQTTHAAATGSTKATTKAKEKAKTVTLNMIIKAEKDAEVEIVLEKHKKKKKSASFEKTVSLKKGMNYFTYNRGKKGNYTVSLIAYGNTVKQSLTAVKGNYTVFFEVAPPKDGDSKKSETAQYQDLTKIK